MQIVDTQAKCSIEIEYDGYETPDYASFTFGASVNIGHGMFKAVNKDINFFNFQFFVEELDAFILDRSLQPKLSGTYDSYLEFVGVSSSVSIRFRIGDAFAGYKNPNTPFAFTGGFDVAQDQLTSIVRNLREMLV
ncbi:MAG: hypothetical protein HYS18_02340 [Burkholderiales bacterium]|nr:hypothetical protein [Burkholderiales bacterium]